LADIPVKWNRIFNRHNLPLLVLALVAFAVYWPAMGHDFLINWDDRQYILENPAVRGFSFDNLIAAFTQNYVGNYAPLQIISYMIDYELWGMHPYGFIFSNILLHTANGILFYLLLRRVSGEKIWIFCAALFFLLHPVQVESVAWVSQRKNLLAMMFFLLSICFYTVYRDGGKDSRRGFYFLSLTAFMMAVLSKSVVVILPLVLISYDFCYYRRSGFKALLFDKIPYFIIAAAFGILSVMSHSAEAQGGMTAYHGGGIYATLLTMIPVLARYLRLIFWPSDLSAFYDVPIKTGIDTEVAMAAVLAALLILGGFLLYRYRRDVLFWYALIFIALIPVSQIVPIVTLMNDRYLYFPMLGVGVVLSSMILHDAAWSDLCGSRRVISLVSIMLLLAVICSLISFQRVDVWRDSYTLWKDTVVKAPGVPMVHDAYGEGLLQQGRIDEAIVQFNIAMGLQPAPSTTSLDAGQRSALANTRNNLGMGYGLKGMTDEAISQFNIALQLNPGLANAHYNLGNALATEGKLADAARSFEAAVRLNPENEAFKSNLDLTRELLRSGDRALSR
jgi:protein O-mannosyl-transferase